MARVRAPEGSIRTASRSPTPLYSMFRTAYKTRSASELHSNEVIRCPRTRELESQMVVRVLLLCHRCGEFLPQFAFDEKRRAQNQSRHLLEAQRHRRHSPPAKRAEGFGGRRGQVRAGLALVRFPFSALDVDARHRPILH